MAGYFFDSSAVVKNYVNEMGTTWVTRIADPMAGHRIHLAQITGVEVVSALTRRAHSGSLSARDAAIATGKFRHDFTNRYVAVDITIALINSAMQLAEAYALRGYDAVQLAAALDVNSYWHALGMQPLTLVSADNDLNAAAAAEGLAVDDPNAHP